MKTYRALIVEDAVDVRRALKAALELMLPGFTVADVPSAEEGLLEVFRQSVDLLVTDFLLPGMTGFELIERMRVRKPEMKIIVVTGQSDPEYRSRALAWGADAFFQKPLEITEFVDCVRELLQIPPITPQIGQTGDGQQQPSLGEMLANLRKEIDANAVLLVDSNGHVEAHAGEYLDYDPAAPYVALLTTIVADSQRLSLYFGRTVPRSYFKIYGKEIALALITVGEEHLLISILPIDQEISNLDLLMQTIAEQLQDNLRKFSTTVETGISTDVNQLLEQPMAEQMAVPEDDEEFLDVIIANPAQRKIKPEDVEAFWEELESEEHSLISGTAEVLTYEQARRLGLAPGQQDPIKD